MNAAAVLVELVDAGASLSTDPADGSLIVDAPRRTPRPLLDRARGAKASLMVVASGAWRAELAAWPVELVDAYEERAAIREHDGGQPRELAEPAAFLEVREASRARA